MRARTLAGGWLLLGAALTGPAFAADAAGPWVWPLAGPHTVSRAFDPPETRYGPGHRGADLPGQPGQAVRAAGGGRISYAGLLAGRGVLVVVHGALRTTYEPVSAVVRVGQQVVAGQLIGHLQPGHPGCPQACLHWGLLRGDVYLDPVLLVSRGRSRLLPVNDVPASKTADGAPGTTASATLSPPAGGGGLPAEVPAAASPGDGPVFALRGGDAASAGGALMALVAGLALLRRPPRPPHQPASPAAVSMSPAPEHPAAAVGTPPTAGLVDLASERHRRRPEVA